MVNKRTVLMACAFVSMLAVIISAMVSLDRLPEPINQPAEIVQQVETDIPAQTKAAYMIKGVNGRLAVFDTADLETPLQVTDIYLETLRNYDQQLLEQGIEVENQEELWRILEDFGS